MIRNDGHIQQNDLGSLTDIHIDGDVTLAGSGIWSMSNSNNNRWLDLNGPASLTNGQDHTIQGTGRIGVNDLRIDNRGTIHGTAGTLAINPVNGDPNEATFTNAGTLRASGGATVVLSGSGGGEFSNTGLFEALDGSSITSDGVVQELGSTVAAGTYRAINGTIDVAAANYQPTVNDGHDRSLWSHGIE